MLPVKDIKRLQEIIAIFVEEGLGYYISKTPLQTNLPWHKRLKPTLPLSNKQRQAVRLRRAFERLGPTFVKFGQLLSLRPDLVPKEYSEEFEKLQDHVPPFSYSQAKRIVEEDLKKPIEKIFKSFDKKPLASASVSQVHKAILKSGKKVVVKVQRPNLREIIDTDLDILFHLAHTLEKHFPKIKNYHPVDVVKEFTLWTRKELNFEIEGHNATILRGKLKNNHRLFIPKIYPAFSSKRVLTMDFVDGVKINDYAALEKYHINRKSLVMTYFTSILEQALLHGLFHADPHPANIFVQKNGKLAYIDYGIVGELNPTDRKKVIRFITSVNDKDPSKSIDIIVSLAKDTSKADLPAFKNETRSILEEVYKSSISEKSIGKALYEIIGRGAQHGVIFDSNHVLMAKSLFQAEGLAASLYPQFKVSEGLDEFTEKYLQETYTPTRVAKKIAGTLWSQKELLEDLPEHLVRIMQKLEEPERPTQIDISQLKELEQEFEYVNRKRVIGIIISALIISSALLFYLEGRTVIWGIPVSSVMFVTALLLLFYFIITTKKEA
ncbi:MAG TPA: AarF/UbiB family protein [Candidatus Nanoarchaeia archaeon]|nr:AarF/UbiB family protein [Candidatus Nanoarchaeia archaeon]